MINVRRSAWKKGIHLLLVLLLAIGFWPPAALAADNDQGLADDGQEIVDEEQEVLVNWLAEDMDTSFASGQSPFNLEKPYAERGGSQQIVQINGNNALELRDSSQGSEPNIQSNFYYELKSGELLNRINEVYRLPVGAEPVEFIFEYKLLRSAASDKLVNSGIYARLQLYPYDDVHVIRFPVGQPSITGTAAYQNSVPNELKTINDADVASYRFQIVPNGGQKTITSFKLEYSVRVDAGGTDEAIVIDDLAVYEVVKPRMEDNEAPGAPSGLSVGQTTDTTVDLAWSATVDNIGVTKYEIYQNGALLEVVSGSTLSHTANGLSPGTTYRFMVKARDAAGNLSPGSNEVQATTAASASGLPVPFGSTDIGGPKLPGSASYDELTDAYTVSGSGADLWGTKDEFHYMYRAWEGDGQIVARVNSMSNTVSWTKAGVMIRDINSPGSPYAMMALTPAYGAVYQSRLLSGGATTQQAGSPTAAAPYWVKLTREGNTISAYYSSDGENWSLAKREALALGDEVYFGLAVTSHDNNKLSAIEFDNVAISEIPAAENSYAPHPGTVETRREWLWDKTKSKLEMGGQLNIDQIVAQLLDGENEAANLQKLATLFQTYDWEQYKTVGKMYAYLLVGDKFDDTLKAKVRDYFSGYAYAKLPQTENLRLSNYTAGYLVGQYLPEVADLNGVAGITLKNINKANIEEMIEAAVHYGWAEYESPEYTFMTYLCLNLLYQFTDEPDFKQKVKMAMDIMWFEWANDWLDGIFISTSNRAKGDAFSASDPTWRAMEHTALAWMYFGSHRAQQRIGESEAGVPASYRPFLEYLGMALYAGMDYTPPEMAVKIGQLKNKDYVDRKTNMQNSSGRNLNTYRQSYVKPTWGLATEVTYNRQDNWIEEIPVVLRWQSNSPNPLFRVNADQTDAPIGNYNQPENHRIMQDGKAAVGVYKSLEQPGALNSHLNAMFPDTGSILESQEQDGWIFNKTEQMYFAFKMVKPYQWYYQTPTDPANYVKELNPHPTKQLHYSYNILRSKADTNGWVLDVADIAEYGDLEAFKTAILTTTELNSSAIDETNPRLVYKNLEGNVMDITFDRASASYNGTHKINGEPIDYDSFKLFDTPWLQQERGSELFTAQYEDEALIYNFYNWTISEEATSGEQVAVEHVSLNASELELGLGKAVRLIAEVSPAHASNRNVTWNSSRPSVATVSSNGTVTGLAPGTTVITVTTEDGAKTAECIVTVIVEPLFEDSFEHGLVAWDLFGSNDWKIQGSGSEAQLIGSTALTGPQRTVVKSSLLPYTTEDYRLSFSGKGDRFRVMFRYSSGTSYYFLEFRDLSKAELWKYPGTSTPAQVGTEINIAEKLPEFELTDTHSYELEVKGEAFRLNIDGELIAVFNDDSISAGSIGFAVKSVGSQANLAVDHVMVMPFVSEPEPIRVTAITLDPTSLTLKIGESASLAATIEPADADNRAVSWSSDNTKVATVDDNGNVTAVAVGTAIITVTTEEGGHSAESSITVESAAVTPPAPGHNGSGTDNGTDTGADNGVDQEAVDPQSQLTISANMLQAGKQGAVVVEASAEIREIRLPVNTSELLGDNRLEVRSEQLILDIPSALFKQIADQAAAVKEANAYIRLTLEPLSDADASAISRSAQQATAAAIRAGSKMYKLGLSIHGSTAVVISEFSEPITLSLRGDRSIYEQLAGVYMLSNSDRPQYAGGEYNYGWWTTEIVQAGYYGVLELIKSFEDLSSTHWAHDTIQQLFAKGIVEGTGVSVFAPDRSVTRAEFVTMLVRALQLRGQADLSFEDVPADAWFADAVSVAYKAGIVNGSSGSSMLFAPNRSITREEMAAMAVRSLHLLSQAAPSADAAAFSDESDLSPWAVSYVKEASSYKLLQGKGNNQFAPQIPTTRAEAAQVLYRLIALVD